MYRKISGLSPKSNIIFPPDCHSSWNRVLTHTNVQVRWTFVIFKKKECITFIYTSVSFDLPAKIYVNVSLLEPHQLLNFFLFVILKYSPLWWRTATNFKCRWELKNVHQNLMKLSFVLKSQDGHNISSQYTGYPA